MATTYTIAFARAAPGRFNAFMDDRLIVENTPSPFLSGARALLAEGFSAPDDDVVLVYRPSPELLCLRATVGDAARDGVFAVLEGDFRYPLNSRENFNPINRVARVLIPRTRTR